MYENDRFNLIMTHVDAWTDENAGWDCRNEAVAEVNWCLGVNVPEWSSVSEMSDEEIAESAGAAWQAAE